MRNDFSKNYIKRHLIHPRSSKKFSLPNPDYVNYGELTVNFAAGHEFIGTKNSNNEIVTFSSDSSLDNLWIQEGDSSLHSGKLALNSIIEGNYAIAEGDTTSALGNASHSEGKNTLASGEGSHVEGYGTMAMNNYEHACGTFNASGDSQIFSVGIGTSDTDRKNAMIITTDGDKLFNNGAFKISGDTNISGDTTINGDMSVSGDTLFSGDTTLSGNTTLSENILLNGNSNIIGIINISGNTTLSENTNIVGDTSISGYTSIIGNTLFSGNTNIDGDTNISGDTSIIGNTSFSGDTTLSGNTYFAGPYNFMSGTTILEVVSATPTTFDSKLSLDSVNAIQNSAITETINSLQNGLVFVKGTAEGSIQRADDIAENATGKYSYSEAICNLSVLNGGTLSYDASNNIFSITNVTSTNYQAGDNLWVSVLDYENMIKVTIDTITYIKDNSNGWTNAALKIHTTDDSTIDFSKVEEFYYRDKNNSASGDYSHAEGFGTMASGIFSHAEGSDTIASKISSHAEGQNTKAVADYSHAEGYDTSATTKCSHTEGSYTVTSNDNEHAQGKYNVSTSNVTIDSVGIGTTNSTRKNAEETTIDGKKYILNVGDYDGTNVTSAGVEDVATVISGINSTIINNEKIVAAALNDLNDRKLNVSAIKTDTSLNYEYSKTSFAKISHVTRSVVNDVTDMSSAVIKVFKTDDYGHVISSRDATLADIEKVNGAKFVKTSGDTMSGNLYIGSSSAITLSTDGNITAKTVTQSSDERLKHDIENIPIEAIEKVKSLDLKSFKFNSDNKLHYGVIAQDVEKKGLKELVYEGDDGYKSVDYTSLLILKIAELEKEIKDLKDELKKK